MFDGCKVSTIAIIFVPNQGSYLVLPVLIRADAVQNTILRAQLQWRVVHKYKVSTPRGIDSIEDLEDAISVVDDCSTRKCAVCEKGTGAQIVCASSQISGHLVCAYLRTYLSRGHIRYCLLSYLCRTRYLFPSQDLYIWYPQ